jgi:hypothetical protein
MLSLEARVAATGQRDGGDPVPNLTTRIKSENITKRKRMRRRRSHVGRSNTWETRTAPAIDEYILGVCEKQAEVALWNGAQWVAWSAHWPAAETAHSRNYVRKGYTYVLYTCRCGRYSGPPAAERYVGDRAQLTPARQSVEVATPFPL